MDILQKTARNAAGDGANLGEPPLEAIGAIMNEVMAMAVANGADSRSMPDDYVAVAAWLSGIPPTQTGGEVVPVGRVVWFDDGHPVLNHETTQELGTDDPVFSEKTVARLIAERDELKAHNKKMQLAICSELSAETQYQEQIDALQEQVKTLRDALKNNQWAEYNDADCGTQLFCTACRTEKKVGLHHPTCEIGRALAATEPKDKQ